MKKILLNIAFTVILGFTSTVYATDIDTDTDTLDANHFSKLPNELMYHICQNLSLKDISGLSRTNKTLYETLDVKFFFHDRFRRQSYISLNLYSPEEFKELQNLALDLLEDVNKIVFPREKEHKDLSKIKQGFDTKLIIWEPHERNGGFILNLHQFKPDVLKFARHENMLKAVSKLLGCPADQVIHKKRNIIYDRYKKFKVADTGIERIAYNSLGLYKQNFCLERDDVDAWQANSFNSCYINAMTLLEPDSTERDPDIIVDVWTDAMAIKSSEQARKFRKTHNPNESIVLKPGDTIFLHPYIEISFRPKDIRSGKICILSNGFAHPTVTRKVKSATIPRLKP